jgi:hypothetical protein
VAEGNILLNSAVARRGNVPCGGRTSGARASGGACYRSYVAFAGVNGDLIGHVVGLNLQEIRAALVE